MDTTTATARAHLAKRVVSSVTQLDDLDRHLAAHHDDGAGIERALLADALLDDLADLARRIVS